jgi:hypothetical protein
MSHWKQLNFAVSTFSFMTDEVPSTFRRRLTASKELAKVEKKSGQ